MVVVATVGMMLMIVCTLSMVSYVSFVQQIKLNHIIRIAIAFGFGKRPPPRARESVSGTFIECVYDALTAASPSSMLTAVSTLRRGCVFMLCCGVGGTTGNDLKESDVNDLKSYDECATATPAASVARRRRRRSGVTLRTAGSARTMTTDQYVA